MGDRDKHLKANYYRSENLGFLGSVEMDETERKAFDEWMDFIRQEVQKYARRKEFERRKYWEKHMWDRMD